MLKNRVNATITLEYLKSVRLANMHDTEQRKETCIRQCARQHTMSGLVQLVSSKLVILEMWDEKGEWVIASYVSCVCVCVCSHMHMYSHHSRYVSRGCSRRCGGKQCWTTMLYVTGSNQEGRAIGYNHLRCTRTQHVYRRMIGGENRWAILCDVQFITIN